MTGSMQCDLAILGGGLAGGLIAHALRVRRPELSIRLIEAEPVLGGSHAVLFFANDIAPEERWIVEPFVARTWNGYDVVFPARRRSLGVRCHAIRPAHFDRALRELLPPDMLMHARVARASATRVVLADGRAIDAGGVIDARGAADLALLETRWQMRAARDMRTARPHGIDQPILIDAALAQREGGRFISVQPFGGDRLLIEETVYSDARTPDWRAAARRIDDYAAQHGWTEREATSEETGLFPVVLDGDFEAYWRSGGEGVAKAGARAALFHPLSGQAVPDAVRLAAHLAALDDLSGDSLHAATHGFAAGAWADRGFYRVLGKLMFHGTIDGERYRTLERFYRQPPQIIERFHGARSTGPDKLRIAAGWTGRPMSGALRAFRGG